MEIRSNFVYKGIFCSPLHLGTQFLVYIDSQFIEHLLLLQTVSTGIAVGSHVWVEDPEVAWIDGIVLEVDGEEITVDCTSGKTVSTTSVVFSSSWNKIVSL